MANDFIFLVPDGGSFIDSTGASEIKERLAEPGIAYTYPANNCGLGTGYGDWDLKACTNYAETFTGRFTCDGDLTTHSNLIVDLHSYVAGNSLFVGVTTNSSTIFANNLNVSGISSFTGITTSNFSFFANQISVSGITSSTVYAASGTSSSTDGTTGTFTVDASKIQLYHHVASFNGNKTFQISNLTNGRSIHLFLKNTDSIFSRVMTIQASTTTSGYSSVEFSGSSVNYFSLSPSNGSAMVWIVNINGNLVGTLS